MPVSLPGAMALFILLELTRSGVYGAREGSRNECHEDFDSGR